MKTPGGIDATSLAGRLVTESFEYDGGRHVTVYVPPNPPEFVVFAGDGQLTSRWGGRLEAAGLLSTMIVGAHRTDDEDEMVRIREYSPSFDKQRFEAHEKFFVQDARLWVSSRFDLELTKESTAVCGVSASGELSLAMGLRHPDIYGTIFSASPSAGFQPPLHLSARPPRTYLVAGTEEPFFLDNATR